MIDYTGKNVLITGSVRNTGYGMAREFAKAGANLIINGRKEEDVKRVAAEIRQDFNVEVIEMAIDLTDEAAMENFFKELDDKNYKLDVLVNNAVVQALGYNFIDTPLEMVRDTFNVNSVATFHCSQLAARLMRNHGGGSIVNIGSNTALRPIKLRSAYVASKGAVDALTRSMAIDLAEFNIRVNSVIAGYIYSERWLTLPQEHIDRRHQNVPLGYESKAADIAQSVMFIASDYSRCTTGTSLTVDGGTSTQLVPWDVDV